MLTLLLDENIPRSAGDLLSAAGHTVLHVSDLAPSADDLQVLALACERRCALVTFDADFGDLIFQRRARPPLSVLYLRMHPIDGATAAELVLRALAEPVDGQFVVCTRDAERRRAIPVLADGG